MKKATIIRLVLFGLLILLSAYLLTGPFSETYLMGIAVIMTCLTGLWVLSLIIKDASIIDIFWGLGFVITVWTYANQIGFEEMELRSKVFLVMVSLWGLRLALYLGVRNIGKGEDYRYKAWREENGKNWWWLSYIRVFVLQGFILWIVSSIFVPALLVKGELGFLEFLGIGLWGIGLFFEAVGDWQLSRFKKKSIQYWQSNEHGTMEIIPAIPITLAMPFFGGDSFVSVWDIRKALSMYLVLYL